ncbi:uncharacterized protein PV06_11935 [Exophiala oligosperma]|uniref:Uncharacterized protein n=1 Tax=Exophiala oligosperma TaxID=215243 RepID=A0A0D2D0G3_9EURO|nr:uncharacterized protein PV06_11935 [Exophiala oligosperma]KIW35725.1 hypothetical protein PV06_11935 [Exophiala oligosperma]
MSTLDARYNSDNNSKFEVEIQPTHADDYLTSGYHITFRLCQSDKEPVSLITLVCGGTALVSNKDLVVFMIVTYRISRATLRGPIGRNIYDENISKKDVIHIRGNRVATKSESVVVISNVEFMQA